MSRFEASARPMTAVKRGIAEAIHGVLARVAGICSVTFVGSFVDREDLAGISDIDTVVVFDRLTPSGFAAAVSAVTGLSGDTLGFPGHQVRVNATLGPLKTTRRADRHSPHAVRPRLPSPARAAQSVYVSGLGRNPISGASASPTSSRSALSIPATFWRRAGSCQLRRRFGVGHLQFPPLRARRQRHDPGRGPHQPRPAHR